MIGVSHWAYDSNSVAKRNYTGKTEEKLMKEWNELLTEKFHIDAELEGVFIDSWSQQPWNIDDEQQQAVFQTETTKLWNFAERNDLFTFRTVGDVLEENQELKAEVKWLNDIITNNISKLGERIAANSLEITKNSNEIVIKSEQIEQNSGIIERNSENLQTHSAAIGSHSESIAKNSEDIVKNYESILGNTNDIAVHSSNIAKNSGDITSNSNKIEIMNNEILNYLPLGSIIPWTPYPDPNTDSPASIPSSWQLCDGSVINEGIWAGHKTPDINNSKRFLRGSIVADALVTEEDSVNTDGLSVKDWTFHTHTGCPDGSHYLWSSGPGTCSSCSSDYYCEFIRDVEGSSSETRPKNMNVVYIIKIK